MNFSKFSISIAFLLLWAASCLLIFITNQVILTPGFYARSGETLSTITGDNNSLYESLTRWSYLLELIYCLFKVILISAIIYCSLYFNQVTVRYRDIIFVVICSEFIFLLAAVIKIIWFYYHYPQGTLADWHAVYILSALSVIDHPPGDWYYPLQTLNLFEIIYWFLLALGVARVTRLDYDNAVKIVISSYVPVLVLWVAIVCFSSVMLFPSQS